MLVTFLVMLRLLYVAFCRLQMGDDDDVFAGGFVSWWFTVRSMR
jgi:hypothetical protein